MEKMGVEIGGKDLGSGEPNWDIWEEGEEMEEIIGLCYH